MNLDLSEIGTRRRVVQEIERCGAQVRADPLRTEAPELLRRCVATGVEAGWLGRCRALVERLGLEAAADVFS